MFTLNVEITIVQNTYPYVKFGTIQAFNDIEQNYFRSSPIEVFGKE